MALSRRCLALACIATIGAPAANATADGVRRLPESIRVHWNVPSGCPDQGVFEAELALNIAPGVARRLRNPIPVRVTVVRRAGSWTATFETPAGSRRLEERDCAELLKTGAVVVGMSIDVSGAPQNPLALQAYDPESPFGDELPRPEEESPPTRVIRDASRSSNATTTGLAVRLFAGGDLTTLPSPTAGAGAAVAMVRGPFRIEATGAFWLGQPAANPVDPGQGAELSLVAVSVAGCHDIAHIGVTAALCAGGELGRFDIAPFGLVAGGETSAMWWGLTGGIAFTRAVRGPVYLRLDAQLTVPLVDPGFTLEPSDTEIHSPGVVGGRVVSGIEVRIR